MGLGNVGGFVVCYVFFENVCGVWGVLGFGKRGFGVDWREEEGGREMLGETSGRGRGRKESVGGGGRGRRGCSEGGGGRWREERFVEEGGEGEEGVIRGRKGELNGKRVEDSFEIDAVCRCGRARLSRGCYFRESAPCLARKASLAKRP